MKFNQISNRTFGIICTVPGLVALLAFILYPIGYNVVVSFLRYNNILPTVFVGVDNYLWLFTAEDFFISWRVSAIYSIGSASLAFFVGLILAHSLNRINKTWKPFFRTLVILPWAVPLILSGLMWKWIFNKDIGLLNYILSSLHLIESNIPFLSDPNLAMLSGIIATAYVHIPFVTILIHAGLQSISPELYEVAQIDGADEFQKFWHITIPLNKTPMLFSFLIIWMFTFRTPDVFFSLTHGGPGKATYHSGLFLMNTIYRHLEFGHGAAISMSLFLTVVVVIIPGIYFGVIRGKEKGV